MDIEKTKNRIKYFIVTLIILNILDAITTSYFVSKLGIYSEGNPIMVYFFEIYDYNVILLVKVLIFTCVLLCGYNIFIKVKNDKFQKCCVMWLSFISMVLFLIVFGNIYAILFYCV